MVYIRNSFAENLEENYFDIIETNCDEDQEEIDLFDNENLHMNSELAWHLCEDKVLSGPIIRNNYPGGQIHFVFRGNGAYRYIWAWLAYIASIYKEYREDINNIEFVFHVNKTFTPCLYDNLLSDLGDLVTIDPTETFSFLYRNGIDTYRLDEHDNAQLVES